MASSTVVPFPTRVRSVHHCRGSVEVLLLLREAKAKLAELNAQSCDRRRLLEATVHHVRRHPIAERHRIIAELGLCTATYQAMVQELSVLSAPITRLEREINRLEAEYHETKTRKAPVI